MLLFHTFVWILSCIEATNGTRSSRGNKAELKWLSGYKQEERKCFHIHKIC